MESGRIVPNPPGILRRNHDPLNGAGSAMVESHLGQGDRELLEALVRSKVFADYQRAFTEATDLPLALCSVQSWQLPHHGRRNEGPFCALMAKKSRSCGACLAVQEKLSRAATEEPHTTVCHAGLNETAVPVRLGDRLIGFLRTGQVFGKTPSESQFQRTVKLLGKWGVKLDQDALRKAYLWDAGRVGQAVRIGGKAVGHLRPTPFHLEQPPSHTPRQIRIADDRQIQGLH